MSTATATATAISHPSIPHPRWRVPLLGDVFQFGPAQPIQSMQRQAEKLGPIFEFELLGDRYVIATGADVVTELNDERRFCKYTGDLEALRIVGGDGLFTAHNDEPNWRKAHELLMPAFTQASMRRYHAIMCDVAAELTDNWDRAAGGRTLDVSAETTRVTLETIGRCAAGHSFGALRNDQPDPFIKHMVAALKTSDALLMLRHSFLPRFLADRAERKLRRHGAYLHRVADQLITSRRTEGLGGHQDLLEYMLSTGPDGEPALDEANIRYQLINFLIAGHETTSGALSFALYFLSRHPEVFARARAEVDEVWGDTARPDFEQVGKLRYVRRVLDETLRLHPTVPGYSRAAREDTVLADRYPMRKGEWAVVLVGALHRDPRWGPDPEAFNPDRFTREAIRERPGNLYKPFGTGKRSCIGRQFALHEAVLLLGTIVGRYDLVADPNYELAIEERLTMMPSGFRLGLRPRAA